MLPTASALFGVSLKHWCCDAPGHMLPKQDRLVQVPDDHYRHAMCSAKGKTVSNMFRTCETQGDGNAQNKNRSSICGMPPKSQRRSFTPRMQRAQELRPRSEYLTDPRSTYRQPVLRASTNRITPAQGLLCPYVRFITPA